ncbi:MAG: hypothetical protein CMB32_04035 [Euryarchaeota archaeon]|nr:hypothetical protein [Euryarchaeota archaeon]|tara:strand:- start:750 stop:2141 length:1392 start_codon:yes stop_codon:yes gene_type:complete
MKMDTISKGLTNICRMVVGALFVVSGLIKSNDAIGFMYKLEEYFEPGALHLEYLTPYALEIAVFVCVGEILLGVAILVGALPRLVSVLTTAMMLFFTWLTWYTATCDPYGFKEILGPDGAVMSIANQCVLECGCFGNAIPLTPIQSFYKDVILMVFVTPILIAAFRGKIKLNDKVTSLIIYTGALVMTFLFGYLMLDWNFPTLYLILCLLAAEGIRKRYKAQNLEWIMAVSVLVVISMFQYTTLSHLPMKDYRPYAEGESIIENRMSAEDLGLQAPVYATKYTYKNTTTGVDTIILSSDYLEKKLWNDEGFKANYEVVSYDGAEVLVKEGYEPRILDFQMVDEMGEDLVDSLLAADGYTFLHISKDLEASNALGQTAFNALAQSALDAGHHFYGLTNVGYDDSETFRHEHQAPYDFLTCDQTELKIVVRSNPGLVLLKEGVVVQKWAWKDIPDYEDLKDNLIK